MWLFLSAEVGEFIHPAESEMLCKATQDKIPYFNAPIYLENKQKIGKIEEVLGPTNEVYFTVKLDDGMNAESFEKVVLNLFSFLRFVTRRCPLGRKILHWSR